MYLLSAYYVLSRIENASIKSEKIPTHKLLNILMGKKSRCKTVYGMKIKLINTEYFLDVHLFVMFVMSLYSIIHFKLIFF